MFIRSLRGRGSVVRLIENELIFPVRRGRGALRAAFACLGKADHMAIGASIVRDFFSGGANGTRSPAGTLVTDFQFALNAGGSAKVAIN
ncbi:hypothetical protein QO004_005056 [Rhizobium mesoamericanum]|uniref:hypothetical protein n=1 Tax=Rhizobium mesoamericanum TaxID=1079800 RepID=UPI002789E324|nr:hypothetical protein [Rhizobium mesoamericanum]MDQ0563247.1 hypothetical protein [Rhizobium mesoamericanum]